MGKMRRVIPTANAFIKELDKVLKQNEILTVGECRALAKVDKKMSNFWYQTLQDHLNNMGDLRHQKAVVENMIRIVNNQTVSKHGSGTKAKN